MPPTKLLIVLLSRHVVVLNNITFVHYTPARVDEAGRHRGPAVDVHFVGGEHKVFEGADAQAVLEGLNAKVVPAAAVELKEPETENG